MSKTDTTLLQDFWTNFKDAVNKKDKVKLTTLCHFPFTCDYCAPEGYKKPYIRINKANFDTLVYKLFLDERLPVTIHKYNLPQDIDIFHPFRVNKKCGYMFEFSRNVKPPGKQHFVNIQNIHGKFRIVGAWTIP
jgi:hypothetical protein